MNVLYANHTARVSGAERSLLDLLRALPAHVRPTLACPEGPLAGAARALGVPVVRLAGTDVSLRLHPLHTARGVAQLLRAATQLLGLARRSGADLVHANSTRAGVVAALASRLGGPPAVVHVRDCLPRGAAADLTRRAIGWGAALVVANSRYSAACFGAGQAPVRTIYNAVDLERFDPGRLSRDEARAGAGVSGDGLLLGVIAQITPWKGQDDAIRMLALLRETRPDARLLVVGEPKFTAGATRYDNEAFDRSLCRLADELGVTDAVSFLGEREDVPALLRALDVLLVPSWEEPFGRTVIEAMAAETPVVATAVGGPAEIVRDGENGFLVPPREPARWRDAVERLAADPDLRARIGRKGRETVERGFTLDAHVEAVLDAYHEALAR